ncbi:MAG TPA: histidine phosphatase family protein, partial [Candidatus Saccharimonadales bacterium]|nr:histidine phosphatase family protein [Candidatus Saccharimonadales bacterium]
VDHPPGARHLSAGLIPDGLDATLVFVRHGESVYITEGRFQGQADTPLTSRGRRQAALVAGRLADPHASPALPIPEGAPRELVHSPLGRTSETAQVITSASSTSVPVRADDGFKEIGQGVWEGLHRDEIMARYGTELATWRRRPTEAWAPGGESLDEVAARVRPALAAALGRLADGGVPGTRDRDQVAGYGEAPATHPWSIVVGHDGIFKVALLTLFDLPLSRFWMWTMELCAISVVEFRAGQAVLRAHNLTGHLATLLDETDLEVQEERARSGAL